MSERPMPRLWWRPALILFVGLCSFALAGCAPVALTGARDKIAHGQYAQAHHALLELSMRTDLSPTERREVEDDLCLSEFMIGRPAYSLNEQRRQCAAAAAQPGSQSADELARVDAQIRDIAAAAVETALRAGDLPAAETAALAYAASPGADPAEIEKWTPQMWQLADRELSERVAGNKKRIASEVASLRDEYPQVLGMSKANFEQWARKSSTAGAIPLVARNALDQGTLTLWIADDELPAAALHLDEFAAINSALAARCGCAARTRVSDAQDGLPAYLFYLDADIGGSGVFILPGARVGEPVTALR
jgi:hypothetical protein